MKKLLFVTKLHDQILSDFKFLNETNFSILKGRFKNFLNPLSKKLRNLLIVYLQSTSSMLTSYLFLSNKYAP